MKAVILCGGLGTRLKGIIDEVPKPMATFQGKPILEYLIEQLSKHFKEIILLIGYKGEVIKNYFGDGIKWGVSIKYSTEEEPLGTGGAISNAKELINDDFILLNGDNYHRLDYQGLKKDFLQNKINTMILTKTINPTQVTTIKVDENGLIIEMKDRSVNPDPEDKWMNAGILLLKKESLDYFPEGKHSMEKIVFPKLIQKGMKGVIYDQDYYIDIGTPPNYYKFKEYSKNLK